MKRYRLKQGKGVFEGTADEVVSFLRSGNAEKKITNWGYMKAVAKRARAWDGTQLSTQSTAAFISDMIAAGFLEEICQGD